MRSNVSDTPEYAAGAHISTTLSTVSDRPVLLLLAGGSSRAVLEHIDESALGPHMTIMMGDERFTEEPAYSNFLQLKETGFYDRAHKHNVNIIETVPDTAKETPESFAIGIDKTVRYYLKTQRGAYVIALCGIGADGHFASIFATHSRKMFYERFHTDSLYIHVHEDSAECTERLTLTPYFIKHYVDEVVLYATGAEKCERVLNKLLNETLKEHELPALIPSRHPHAHLFTDCTVHT